MQNHQKKTYVTQLHKVYNIVSQASLQLMTDKNAVNLSEAGIYDDTTASEFIKKYFKIVKDCGTDALQCFPQKDEYKKMSGENVNFWNAKRHFILSDGTAIATYFNNQNKGLIMEIWLDINGQKGPNIAGRDLFIMFLYNNGLLDDLGTDDNGGSAAPLSRGLRETKIEKACIEGGGSNIHGCFGKILNDNWEMTY